MARVTAWACLRSGNPAPLREVDRLAHDRDLDPRDRALVRQLVGTELRHRGTLRAIVREFTHHIPSADLSAHLHLGLVQLLYLERVPDHAAVSATVSAAG
jgi:16S rRNA (cytosine967-C5)-methyltransferase